MSESSALDAIRQELDQINDDLLHLFSRRATLALEVRRVKEAQGTPLYQPEREAAMLEALVAKNRGPFTDEVVRALFRQVFRASVSLMEDQAQSALKVSRLGAKHWDGTLTIRAGTAVIGRDPILIAGPCAVESEAQMDVVGARLAALGIRFLRGGAYKPRSSPYAFQGLGELGLRILRDTARRHELVSVTEVMDPRAVDMVASYADVLQIGSRNMHNSDLLREVGRIDKPILLKRGLSATIEEFLWAAEYIVCAGNQQVILCERGIRTFERATRNTLDISAVPLLKQSTYLPVVVDVSHAAGRKDILAPLGRAALAAGADGLMIETHPHPELARSDSEQQLNLDEFEAFVAHVGGRAGSGALWGANLGPTQQSVSR
jgi:3-deoxy-7-phosphoheptulonate synthase/chorismate mutase